MKVFSGTYLLCGKDVTSLRASLHLLQSVAPVRLLTGLFMHLAAISPSAFADTSLYLEVFCKILQLKLGRESITRRVLSLDRHAPYPGNVETAHCFPPSVS